MNKEASIRQRDAERAKALFMALFEGMSNTQQLLSTPRPTA